MNAFDFKEANVTRHNSQQLKVPVVAIAALSGSTKRLQQLSDVLAAFNLSFNDYAV